MVTKKTTSCACVDCKCDPCECENGACSTSKICSSTWCNWGAALRIAIAVGLILVAFALGFSLGSHNKGWDREEGKQNGSYDQENSSRRGAMMQDRIQKNIDPMIEHCKMMPEMRGCEKYNTTATPNMSHDMMSMSMADMSTMMAGKTGDALDRAFLEGMIPHHQGAVDMAKMMAVSKHPELVKFANDIIAGQSREIEQMRQWLRDWGYTSTGATSTGMMNM